MEQKLSTHHAGCYNITEAQAIVTELRNIQKSLSSGEKEKAELMQSLAQLKDELTRLQLCEGSPDASTLSLPQEKLSTASQTDLSGELLPIGTRLAEMARMRLEYDEARKRIQRIQQQLADLEEKVFIENFIIITMGILRILMILFTRLTIVFEVFYIL